MGTTFDKVWYEKGKTERMCPVPSANLNHPPKVNMGRPKEEGGCTPCCRGTYVFTCPECKSRWIFGKGSWTDGDLIWIE